LHAPPAVPNPVGDVTARDNSGIIPVSNGITDTILFAVSEPCIRCERRENAIDDGHNDGRPEDIARFPTAC